MTTPGIPGEPLSNREMEILALFAEGLPAHGVGKRLWITEETVRAHRKRILGKMNARNMVHCVHLAHLTGLFGTQQRDGSSAPLVDLERAYGHVPLR